jgi:hypothetical protein
MDFLLSLLSRHCPPQGERLSQPLAPANACGMSTKCLHYSLAILQVLASIFLGGILHAQNIMSASQLLTLHQKNVLGLLLG